MRIGLLADMGVEHFRGAMRGIAEYARRRNDWQLCRSSPTVDGLRRVMELGAKGVILGTIEREPFMAARVEELPTVSLGAPYPPAGLCTVTHDEVAVGRMAAEYLLRQRFTHFAACCTAGKSQDERVTAFAEAIRKSGRDCPVLSEDPPEGASALVGGQLDLAREQRLSDWLERLVRPVAVFCDCDERGWVVAELSRRLGLSVPGEIAILSVDNDETVCALTNPALSSVQVASEHIGYVAAETLALKLSGQAVPLLTTIPPVRVVERRSTDASLTGDPLVARALGFMRKSLRDKQGIDGLAQTLACSRRSLERRFLEVTGTSPANMWTRFRLLEAQRLLLETDLSVELISDLCGFSDSRGLSANFRKQMGLTPTEFRRRARL
jgi:LacI family transcriptional regulator